MRINQIGTRCRHYELLALHALQEVACSQVIGPLVVLKKRLAVNQILTTARAARGRVLTSDWSISRFEKEAGCQSHPDQRRAFSIVKSLGMSSFESNFIILLDLHNIQISSNYLGC